MKRINIFLLGLAFAVLTGCTYSFPDPEQPTNGTADYSKVVVVGNSLSAGYMDGALYDAGQQASYANIVAQQMALIDGGEFNQPDINAPDGYFGLAGTTVLGRLVLVNPLNPAPSPIVPGQAITEYSGDKASLNNFAVPGMRVVDMTFPGYGLLNPYYNRFASDPATSTVQGDATAADGTFIIYWLGGNDALSYATQGATANPDGDGTNPDDMTSAAVFAGAYQASVAALITDPGKQGILINVPDVQVIPYFTTVPWNSIPMDQATADLTNMSYIAFNGGIKSYNAGELPGQVDPPAVKRDTIHFKAGQNGPVIYDSTMTDLNAYGLPTIRMAKSSDLLTLTAATVLGTELIEGDPTTTIGVGVPLAEKYTLVLSDQETIADRIAAFNSTIEAVANASNGNLALLDFNSILNDFAQNGASINGSTMDATILPPFGAFSLDGVHPNQRGSAYVASNVITIINEHFGSNIPNVNPNDWPGNALPILIP